MPIDSNNPPVESSVISMMRASSTTFPASGGGMNILYAESGVAGVSLRGLYFGAVTNSAGDYQWAYVGGYGVYLNANNALVFGRSSSQAVSEVILLGTDVLDGSNGGASIRVSSSTGTRVYWAHPDGMAITGASDELNVYNGGERVERALVADQDYTVVDGTAAVVYTSITNPSTRTVTLPAAGASQAGRVILVASGVATTSATAVIRTVVSGGGTISGNANVDITTEYGMASFFCTGSTWILIGSR